MNRQPLHSGCIAWLFCSVLSCAALAETYDFGDLPAPYATLANSSGPRHSIAETIYLGTVKPDAENDGVPSSPANGDDVAGADDEDSIDAAAVQCLLGLPLEVSVRATNLTGHAAEIRGFIDWNADGDFGDPGEIFTVPVADGLNQSLISLAGYVTVPLDATQTQSIPLRLRISSKLSITEPSVGPGGAARDGEVEDYVLRPAMVPLDFGDLPDAPWYPTVLASDGARHAIVAGLHMGKSVDAETDGAPADHALGDDVSHSDDEDGFDPAAVHPEPGNPVSFKVRVTTPAGPGAKLYGFADWNNDGDFEDQDERSTADVPASLANEVVDLPWHVPAEALVGEKLAVRLRLVAVDPTGYTQPLEPNGHAASGEVEDYRVFIHSRALDFGDLPDAVDGFSPPILDPATCSTLFVGDYKTRLADNGARHGIRPDLVLAQPQSPLPIDAEADGQPDSDAAGDDLNADDEDGLTFGAVSGVVVDNVTPTSADALIHFQVLASVKNETGSEALVSLAWAIDGSMDGGYVTLPSAPGFQQAEFNFALPFHLDAQVKTANFKRVARARLVAGIGSLSTSDHFYGELPNGEVEDYIVDGPVDFGTWWQGSYLDYGDLDDAKYPTTLAQNGARHAFTLGGQNIFLGANAPDGDADGKSSANADGDDVSGIDDEEGFDPSAVAPKSGSTVDFAVKVTSASASRLFGFVDWNNDGDFADTGETSSIAIAGGTSGATVYLPWSVPFDAVTGQPLGVRLRISTANALGPDGLAPDGEVEDYLVTVGSGYDFGDLPDSATGTAPGSVVNSSTVAQGDYQTRLTDNGPSHKIRADLSLFDSGDPVDAEADGQPSADAKGDDNNHLSDEADAICEVVKQTVSNITTNSFDVSVQIMANLAVDNRTGDRAYLTGFLDANNDGDFSDSGEFTEVGVPSAPGYPSYNLLFTANWTVQRPTTSWTVKLPARFRLSTQSGLGPAGPAPDGEVEDYIFEAGFTCDEWWNSAASRPLFDKGTAARIKAPAGFGSGASDFAWEFGSAQSTAGGTFTATGTNPLLLPAQLGGLPSGMVPYSLTARRSDTALDSYLGFAAVKDLPNFRSFMQRTPSITGETAAPDEDPDRDGRSNFIEYAQGTDPSKGDAPQNPPVLSTGGAVRTLTVPYLRRTGGNVAGGGYMTSELVYQPEGSTNLASWNLQPASASAPSPLPSPPPNYEWGAVSLPTSNSVPKAFIRLRTGVR